MTSTPEPPAAAAFARIKIRTGALVFCGDYVALIRRDRSGSTHYTPPGGNVEPGEDLDVALAHELAEELDLNIDQPEGGDLMWVVDQRVTRPGPTPPPRKLHLIYRLHITPEVRATLAEVELDELPDGSHETGVIEWVDYRRTAELPIFPPVGAALAALPHPRRRRPRSRHRRQLHLGLISLPDAGPAAAASPVRPSPHAMRQCHRLDSHNAAGRQ
ncbi:NUDIX domain-containing protein [Streptomyces griseus]|uniref:NUDIX domain-containing protein n=1 Tax=Streptomyces griseus TaxID=1911 RepID=UPI0018FE6859|nr:NUDIX domain-containing protein [Streptomyces griseus]